MIRKKLLTSAAAVTLCALISAQANSNTSKVIEPSYNPVTYTEISNDAKSTEDVLTYGLGQQGQRYSTLEQINKKTIKDLVPVWNFSFGGEKQRGQESQPIIKDGVMYVTGSYSRVFAINIANGEEIWQYDAKLPDAILPCCDVINRGVAIYDNLVIFGTLDAKLVALDRKTGNVVWKKKVEDYKDGYSITAAPMIVKDLVITGVAGGEFIIPTLILLFGMDPKLAGSVSLCISLPTMLVAFSRYTKSQEFQRIKTEKTFLIFMIVGSFIGAFIGSLLLEYTNSQYLTLLLGFILLISAWKVFKTKAKN